MEYADHARCLDSKSVPITALASLYNGIYTAVDEASHSVKRMAIATFPLSSLPPTRSVL